MIAELQSREVGHTEQVLDLQTRLDKCTEELQQTSREKSEVEILLQQTKTELLSRANDAMEVQVSRLLEERDESLDEVESRHAKEIDRVQGAACGTSRQRQTPFSEPSWTRLCQTKCVCVPPSKRNLESLPNALKHRE